ncbi:MAG: MMPL family transporter, partial [Spirochaetaceae bacterium]|nr:MMPL family transporter [Spirochaetaceae bacterium]
LKRPLLVTACIAGITLFFGFQLSRVELDNNNFRFVPKEDGARLVSDYIDEEFGSSTFILVGLATRYGTVFDRAFLLRLKEYVERIKTIDYVGDLSSLISSDYIAGDADTITVEPLTGEAFAGTSEEARELKRRLLSWDLYRRALYSDDFTATQILIPLDITQENAGNPEVVASFLRIRDIAKEMFSGMADVYVTGLPVISATINESVKADLTLLVPLVILVVVVIVFIPLRSPVMVALSLVSVVAAVIWSVGAMPLFGIKLSVISTVLPVILIAVGSSYGLHLIIHYLEDAGNAGQNLGAMDREAYRLFIADLTGKIGKPLFLAMLTTMVSFLSFSFTRVVPMREFGWFSSFGVAASFIITITLVPALLLLRGPKPLRKGPVTAREHARSGAVISGALASVAEKRRTVMAVSGALLCVSLYGASKLVIDNVFIEYFKADTDIYKSEVFIRERFGGSKVISMVVQAETPEVLLHPDTLSAVDRLNAHLTARVPEVGKVMGFTDLVKRMNQVFNADGVPARTQPPAPSGEEDTFGFGSFPADNDDAAFGFGSFPAEPAEPAEPSAPVPAADSDGTDGIDGMGTEEREKYRAFASLLEQAAGEAHERSAADLARAVARLLNYDGAGYYEIPQDPARYGKRDKAELQRLVSNYLVLLSGNIDTYANDPLEPTAMRTTIQLRTTGQADTDRAVDEIQRFVRDNFPPDTTVLIGGGALVEGSLNMLVVKSLFTSMIIALAFLFCIIAVANRSLLSGLVCAAPLVLLITVNFAVMGFLGIKLNIGTAMIASLTMGIGIDYTIHFLEAYKREAGAGGALTRVFQTAGIAIIIDALSVGAGFGVLLFSRFIMLRDLGLLIALAMLLSALAGLILTPALLS